jgi:hypothetical protein
MRVLRNDLYRTWFAGDKDWGFEVIDGEYSGVVVQIESIEFSKKDDGTVDLNFHVINKDKFPDLDTGSDLFNKNVELIINDIFKEAIDHYEQTRNNDPQEFGQ